MDAIVRHEPRADGHVLDIGCGDGLFFPVLRRWGTVEGVEADASLVTRTDHPEGRIYVTPFDRTFRPAKKYSLIVMLDVLEHLPDADAALSHAVSLLEPDGLLVLTVPAFRLLWTQHDEMNRHYTRYTEASFRPLARRCGLQLDECRYFYHWLFPLKMAVRAREWYQPADAEPPAVPEEPWNRLFTSVSRLEQRICRHWNLPFGSSLLAVGKRSHRARPVARSRRAPQTIDFQQPLGSL